MKSVKIFWKYSGVVVEVKNKKKRNLITECIIEQNSEPKAVITHGKATCLYTDNFSKRIGRKESFKRAVSMLPNKQDRKELWEKFISQSPKSIKKF